MPRLKGGKEGKGKTARYFFYLVTIAIVAMVPALIGLYDHGFITLTALSANLDIDLSMFFSFIVFSYLLARGQRLGKIIKGLGLSKDRITTRNMLRGLLLFALILLTEFMIEGFSAATGIQLPTNVSEVLSGMPLYFLLFTFIVAPINEEILFRGFLVPKLSAIASTVFSMILHRQYYPVSQWIGIIASAMLFALPHLFTYASLSEFFAALVFGLLAGYFFKRYKSLYTTVLAHALVNLLTIAAISFMILI